jgi:hypothetical protein
MKKRIHSVNLFGECGLIVATMSIFVVTIGILPNISNPIQSVSAVINTQMFLLVAGIVLQWD